ncbi:MAG: hypothetical protein ACREL9_07955 [Gemmatimonadales bacterium]
MRGIVRVCGAALVAAALCCRDQGPDQPSIPPPGPHFTHAPIPVATLARITPIGYNNKVFPTPHTYWITCDAFIILQSTRPCHRERQSISAPGSGVVVRLAAVADGYITVEGPRGLVWTFGHVTPAPGLAVGSAIAPGQVVATMLYEHGFDFGLLNYGVERAFVVPERYHAGYLNGQNPIEQFPEPLKSDLLARVTSLSDPLGRLTYDVAGTASGGWFIAGSPKTNEPLMFGNEHMLLWLARYVEREETRIVSLGDAWPGMTLGHLVAVDPAAPAWESITPASGRVALRLWAIGADALPNTTYPAGTLLVELTGAATLRVEWFDTHSPVSAFTAGARTYER